MKRALGVSAIVHLLVIGVVYAAARERPAGAPVRIYTVDVVNWQTGPRGGPGTTSPATAVRTPAPARPSQPAQATTRSGVKTPTAPSRETEAPRGQRRPRAPAADAAQTPAPNRGGGLGVGQGRGSLRVDGEPFPFPEYLQELVTRIEARWQPPPGGQGRRATVFFTIDRQGRLAASRVEVGSGHLAFDQSTLAAVVDASPFAALPSGYAGTRLSVHLDFVE